MGIIPLFYLNVIINYYKFLVIDNNSIINKKLKYLFIIN